MVIMGSIDPEKLPPAAPPLTNIVIDCIVSEFIDRRSFIAKLPPTLPQAPPPVMPVAQASPTIVEPRSSCSLTVADPDAEVAPLPLRE